MHFPSIAALTNLSLTLLITSSSAQEHLQSRAVAAPDYSGISKEAVQHLNKEPVHKKPPLKPAGSGGNNGPEEEDDDDEGIATTVCPPQGAIRGCVKQPVAAAPISRVRRSVATPPNVSKKNDQVDDNNDGEDEGDENEETHENNSSENKLAKGKGGAGKQRAE